MIKPVGPYVLIKMIKEKKESNIVLLEDTQVHEEVKAVVQQVGTNCSMGLAVGHEVMFKANALNASYLIDKDEDLIIFPENQIVAILNYSTEETSGE